MATATTKGPGRWGRRRPRRPAARGRNGHPGRRGRPARGRGADRRSRGHSGSGWRSRSACPDRRAARARRRRPRRGRPADWRRRVPTTRPPRRRRHRRPTPRAGRPMPPGRASPGRESAPDQAQQVAAKVHDRRPAVAGIERGLDLDQTAELPLALPQGAVQPGDVPPAGGVPHAERVAHDEHLAAQLGPLGRGMDRPDGPRRDPQQRQARVGVGRQPLHGMGAAEVVVRARSAPPRPQCRPAGRPHPRSLFRGGEPGGDRSGPRGSRREG